ncbi:MAG: NADH-quinone oxidoreductase subunit C [Candidatus Nitricoxidivorans perseverans]|uniref:NADH-quinone oxidoreductase subunit C n=1 Tax=Candidatus Nitricoxidivorans perseverans TaxID=2975601 RepID=A0AA49FKQ0_9PROT|nr:MAG: NADH-quinone oxidoreductase subunit C [Candidatus Nitricoxidivorans perseverans]
MSTVRFLDQPIEFAEQEGVGAPVWIGQAPDGAGLLAFAVAAHRAGGRLAAIWGSDERKNGQGFRVNCVFGIDAGHAWVRLDLAEDNPVYPDLAGIFPAANRMQRATRDMVGIAIDGGDQRPWLRHGGWPADWFPLRHDAPAADFPNGPTDYDFVRVEGKGAHEIPVGPIHAGIIEPGHFRFSVVGERVLRLEQRLGYQHKGVERRLIGMDIDRGAKLVGRISGDSTCAYAWAYAVAVESACGVEPPPRALGLRALMLERERVANHLGDLGMLGNDAAFGFGLTQFFKLKEDWVRLSHRAFGHRFMMDCIVPGGIVDTANPDAALRSAMAAQCDVVEREVRELKVLYDEHAGLQDRFLTTGAINDALAQELSLTGIAARATGTLLDGRVWSQGYEPPVPYAGLGVRPVSDVRGDVAARAAVRFAEVFESLRLIRKLVAGMPGGSARAKIAPRAGKGLGVIEGWRGEVLVGVELDAEGRILRAHPHDPSWQVWPALEHAVMKDIVPDFPLINKSFNLSYSGQDI